MIESAWSRLMSRVIKSIFGVLWRLLVALIFIGLGALLAKLSFDQLREVRQIERIPESLVMELLPGEAKTQGRVAVVGEQVLTAPFSGKQTVYYEEHVERRETDSDGESKWVTVRRGVRAVDFAVADQTGEALLRDPLKARITAPTRYSRTEGDLRYTERRIDPGDAVFVCGYVRLVGDWAEFVFDVEGDYVPIIAEGEEAGARGSIAFFSILSCGGAVLFWSLAVLLLCNIFRIHLTIVFISVEGVLIAGCLFGMGLHAARLEMEAAAERIERVGRERLAMIRTMTGVAEADWQALPLVDGGEAVEAVRLRAAVLGYAQAVARYNRALATPPEVLVGWLWEVKPFEKPKLSGVLLEEFERREAAFQRTRLGIVGTVVLLVGGLGLAVLFSRLGFRTVARKRLIENIPTSRTTGVVYGLNELVGNAVVEPPGTPLSGPLSRSACIYYRYVIMERRGSGKKARWVKVHDEERRTDFKLRDADGEIAVMAAGATFLCGKWTRQTEGNRRHTEQRVETGDQLYLLGSARPDAREGDHLVIAGKDEAKVPYLIANLSQREVLLHKARVAFGWLTAAMDAMAFAALAIFAALGGLSALMYSFAALGPMVYALGLLAVLMFNDLVFLRQRTRATWSNIEVALKKRYDLIGQLQKVVAGMLGHERELMERVGSMRGGAGSAAGFLALREAYPELETNALMGRLSTELARVENEIALMREGYNNAVERYNTRRAHFPEILFSRAFHFRDARYWTGEDDRAMVEAPGV